MVRWSSLVAVAVVAVGVLFAGSARAGTNCADLGTACNGAAIFAGSGTENCKLEASATCMADCKPLDFQVQCSGQLEAGCMGSCQATPPSASCTGSCNANCSAKCSGGNFSCQGSCQADCQGNCSGVCMSQCASSGSSSSCMSDCTAQCNASCGARCKGSCTGQPPDCMSQCNASCNGECSVTPGTLNCDVSCQAMGYVNCTSQLQGGCQANCSAKGGLFCNGQFVNVNGSQLDDCANALECEFNIMVSGYANGSASCDGGTCTAQAAAGASASCDMSPNTPPISGGLLALGLGGLAAGIVRRRIRARARA